MCVAPPPMTTPSGSAPDTPLYTSDLRFWGARSLSRAIAHLNSLPGERKYTPLLAASRAPYWWPTCWIVMSLNLSVATIVTSQLSAAFQTIAETPLSVEFFCYIVFTNNTTPRPLIHYIFSGRGSRWNCYIHWQNRSPALIEESD